MMILILIPSPPKKKRKKLSKVVVVEAEEAPKKRGKKSSKVVTQELKYVTSDVSMSQAVVVKSLAVGMYYARRITPSPKISLMLTRYPNIYYLEPILDIVT